MIIALTPDIEQALTAEAQRLGLTPAQCALESRRARFMASESDGSLAQDQSTLADFLCGHMGVLHSSEHVPSRARLSEDSGRKFAAGLVARRQRQWP